MQTKQTRHIRISRHEPVAVGRYGGTPEVMHAGSVTVPENMPMHRMGAARRAVAA